MFRAITDGIRPVSGVEFPERRKLKFFDKVPQLPAQLKPPKMMKDLYDMRGPELIHNKLQYGEFGIQVCITITVSLSLHHYQCIVITITITVTASLSLYRYCCITIPASLSLHHYQCITISLSSTHHNRLQYGEFGVCITTSLSPTTTGYSMGSLEFVSLPVCHPPQQAAVWGVWSLEFVSLPVCHPPQQAAVWGVWSLYHYQSVTHHDRLQYGEFGIQICITITVTVSLTHQSRLQFGEFGIQVCITVIVSLISLSPTTTGYSMGTREFGIQVCITITVMLLYQNYHYSPEQASVRGVWNSDLCQRLLFYHYQSVTYPPQQAIQNGEFGIQVCCITITVSRSVCDLPTTTSYSMGRLVFRSVSLSLNHYHCITIIVSLSLTHHNRLHHSNDCV